MNRKIILLLSDTHAGSEYGLTHPETILERESAGKIEQVTPALSEIQRFMFYDIFRPSLAEAMKFAGNDEVIAIHEGDATQGVKYEPGSISDQILIAVQNMTEILKYKNVTKFRMLKSTPSHALGDYSDADVLITTILGKTFPQTDIRTHYHGEYLIKDVDVLMDCSHHGPSRGIRKWLEGNNFRFYMRDILIRKMLRRTRPPDIITRSHTHGKLEEHLTVEGHRCWGFITPPMQFPSAYVRQVTRSVDEIEMGMLMIEVIQHSPTRKTIYPYWLTKTLSLPTKEIL